MIKGKNFNNEDDIDPKKVKVPGQQPFVEYGPPGDMDAVPFEASQSKQLQGLESDIGALEDTVKSMSQKDLQKQLGEGFTFEGRTFKPETTVQQFYESEIGAKAGQIEMEKLRMGETYENISRTKAVQQASDAAGLGMDVDIVQSTVEDVQPKGKSVLGNPTPTIDRFGQKVGGTGYPVNRESIALKSERDLENIKDFMAREKAPTFTGLDKQGKPLQPKPVTNPVPPYTGGKGDFAFQQGMYSSETKSQVPDAALPTAKEIKPNVAIGKGVSNEPVYQAALKEYKKNFGDVPGGEDFALKVLQRAKRFTKKLPGAGGALATAAVVGISGILNRNK